MPGAVKAELVAPHDADRTETDLRVGANRRRVVGGGVDHEPVVAVVNDQVPSQRTDSIGAQAAAVHCWIDIDVDAGMPVIRLGFGVPLDGADDVAVVLDDEGLDVRLREILGDR